MSEPREYHPFRGPDGNDWHYYTEGNRMRVLDSDGEELFAVPTNPEEAARLWGKAMKAGIKIGESNKAHQIRQALGVAAMEGT